MAEKKNSGAVIAPTENTNVNKVPYGEDKVQYTAPRNYAIDDEEDLYVCARGKRWKIPRGVTVEIPRYVLWVIEDAERQKMAAYKQIEKTIKI